MKNKKIGVLIMCAVAVMILIALPCIAQAAIVITDYPEYGQGEVVTIVGVGWQPGESVLLELFDSSDPAYHPFVNNLQADAAGNFINTDYIIQEGDEGRTFVLTATGESSGSVQTTFSDAAHLHFFEDASQNIPRDAFEWGTAMYARADDLDKSRPCWQVRWIDPNDNVVETHNLDAALTKKRDDSFVVPALGPSGVWRAELYKPSNNSACGDPMTFSLKDTLYFDVAQIVVIGADDAYVVSHSPDLNTNSGLLQLVLDVNGDPDDTEKTFLRFTLPTPPWSVVSAKVRTLVMLLISSDQRTYDIHRVTGPWDVDAITWNNRPGVAAAPTDSQQTPPGVFIPFINLYFVIDKPMRWDVTSDVTGFQFNLFPNYGWRISDSEGADPEALLYSTEVNALLNSKLYGPVLLMDTQVTGTSLTAVPTMTEWGMIIFVLLAGLGAVYYLIKQRRAQS